MKHHISPLERYFLMRLPRDQRGWIGLFWFAMRRCPVHHTRLVPRRKGYGMCEHDGIEHPRGLCAALRRNWREAHFEPPLLARKNVR